jgi:hypothetical protein
MMKRGARAPPIKPISEVPRSVARPILATANSNSHQTILSPKTTRRNMATELTESLRQHLAWERRQRNRNPISTSTDVANLKQYPEKPFMKAVDNSANNMDTHFSQSYYKRGW